MAVTKLSELINPEVIGSSLAVKLVDMIKFAPLAVVGRELQGSAGDTLTIPVFEYIGDAEDVAEGVAINPVQLKASTASVTVKKAGKGVEITDEAVLSAYGNPLDETERQLGTSISSKIDNDCLAALGNATLVHDAGVGVKMGMDVIADALVKYGEDLEEEVYLYVSPTQYTLLRKDPDFVHIGNGAVKVSGQVGMIYGATVVVSNKIVASAGTYNNFMIKPGAIGIEMKRDVDVETDRNILTKTSVITADVHFAAYLRDASKAIKIICEE